MLVSAPWVDYSGSRSAISYLSTRLREGLDAAALSAIDRISIRRTDDPVVLRIIRYVNARGVDTSEHESGFPLTNSRIEDLDIPEGYIFIADGDANGKPGRALQGTPRISREPRL